jgi:hypothetical protein
VPREALAGSFARRTPEATPEIGIREQRLDRRS